MANGNGHPANHFFLPHWRYAPKLKGLSGIYLNIAMRDFSLSLIGIFIPIYLYKLTGDLKNVFLFYFIRNSIMFVTVFPIAKIISRIGSDLSMLISNITESLFLVLLAAGGKSPVLLWLSPILTGLTVNFYWLAYHSAFSKVSKSRKLPKQMANISNISRLVCVLAPLAGGIVAANFGFSPLLTVGVIILTVSSLPIFLDEYDRREKIPSFSTWKKNIFRCRERHLIFSYFFQGIAETVDVVVWPVFIFLLIPSLEKIGGITTVTLLVSLAIVYYLSEKINRFRMKPFFLGNLGKSFIWLVRIVCLNPFIIALSDPLYQISSIFVDFPRGISLYRLGKKNPLRFFSSLEASLHLGRTFSALLMFWLLSLGFDWKATVILSIMAIALTTILIREHFKNEQISKPFRPKFGRL